MADDCSPGCEQLTIFVEFHKLLTSRPCRGHAHVAEIHDWLCESRYPAPYGNQAVFPVGSADASPAPSPQNNSSPQSESPQQAAAPQGGSPPPWASPSPPPPWSQVRWPPAPPPLPRAGVVRCARASHATSTTSFSVSRRVSHWHACASSHLLVSQQSIS